MKIKPQLLLVAGFGVAVFITATYASIALLKPKPSAWQLVTENPEFAGVVKNSLKPLQITYKESIEAATIQRIGSRHTVYRFKSKKTCGRRGCLHVIIDNHMQRQKPFTLNIPDQIKEESYMFVENDCVVAMQLDRVKVETKYPLCLKLN